MGYRLTILICLCFLDDLVATSVLQTASRNGNHTSRSCFLAQSAGIGTFLFAQQILASFMVSSYVLSNWEGRRFLQTVPGNKLTPVYEEEDPSRAVVWRNLKPSI